MMTFDIMTPIVHLKKWKASGTKSRGGQRLVLILDIFIGSEKEYKIFFTRGLYSGVFADILHGTGQPKW